MYDAHGLDIHHDRVIYIMHHVLERLIHPLSPHVQLHLEIKLPLADRILALNRCGGTNLGLDCGLELVGRNPFHLVQRHLALDIAHYHRDGLVRHYRHFAHHAVGLHPDFLADS